MARDAEPGPAHRLGALTGVQEWAYESPVDGSGQPFKMAIPSDYDPARRYRVALPTDFIWQFVPVTRLAPRDYRQTDLDAGSAVERSLAAE